MPTVIVENDVSQWDDLTGEVYHFPKRYKELLLPGEKVIYYKGRIKDKSFKNQRLSPDPHYFGIAEIGKIISIKDGKELLGEILNFRPFIKAVNFQDSEGYLEKIPKNKEKNYWRDGVRKIDEDTYKRIVDLENLGPVREAKSSVNTDDQSFVSGVEGRQSYSFTTKYERDPELRKQALLIHGYVCAACSFNFEKFYGEYAKGFIHIHHIEPLFESGEKVVNPETDLIPLCANCHAIIHRRRNKTLTIEELKNMIDQNKL